MTLHEAERSEASSLDSATKRDFPLATKFAGTWGVDTREVGGVRGSGWVVNVYPDCGEVSIQLRALDRLFDDEGPEQLVLVPPLPAVGDDVVEAAPRVVDEQASRRSACNRAKVRVRRFCTANRLDRMITLTYTDPEFDSLVVARDVKLFVRRLRSRLGLSVGEPFQYLWVRELHPGGHGYHVHMLVSRFVHHEHVRRCWPKGQIVDVRKVRVPKGRGGGREASRRAAAYVQKYVVKSFNDQPVVPKGHHRYDCSRGCQPARAVRSVHSSLRRAWLACAAVMEGEFPSIVFSSYRYGPDYPGPPLWLGFWT
jgi:hypothetical protein